MAHLPGEARALVVLGSALHATGRSRAGTDAWTRALALFTDMGAGEAERVRSLLASVQAPIA